MKSQSTPLLCALIVKTHSKRWCLRYQRRYVRSEYIRSALSVICSLRLRALGRRHNVKTRLPDTHYCSAVRRRTGGETALESSTYVFPKSVREGASRCTPVRGKTQITSLQARRRELAPVSSLRSIFAPAESNAVVTLCNPFPHAT